jgi:dTDP-4-amino-4,6-dideoxy-D-glucose acyltransferase
MEFILSGSELMGDFVRSKLKKCGDNVRLYPLCKIAKPEVVELDDNCRIRDFAFIWGGRGVIVGKYSDVQPHVVVWGGGNLRIGNYVSVGVGTIILTATYDYNSPKMVDGVPDETKTLFGRVIIEDNCYIGAHCTIMPNVKIGEGCVIGANSLVLKDTEPWGIYVGSPCRKIGIRPKGAK